MLKRNKTGIGRFSILVGMVLSEWKHEWMGNFTTYPRSHIMIERLLKQYGHDTFIKKQNDITTRYNWNNGVNKINARQTIATPGDIILCHPFLAHRVAPNYSNDIRDAVFMRPTKMGHKQNMDAMIHKKYVD